MLIPSHTQGDGSIAEDSKAHEPELLKEWASLEVKSLCTEIEALPRAHPRYPTSRPPHTEGELEFRGLAQ